MNRSALPRLLVIASVAFAIFAPASQALVGWGLSAAEFSASGNQTLRAAGYAFSMWGLLYAGMATYAVYQALPASNGSEVRERLAWPSIVAIAGCGAWICASALDWRWATVAIIVTAAAALTLGLVKSAHPAAAAGMRDRLLILWPLAALAGWLTVASAINILTVLTAEGLIDGDTALVAGLSGIAVVLAVALLVLRATRMPAYGLPIAWGLVAVWVAERADNATAALAALGAAILILAYAAVTARRRS
jgi:hypothetical protein